MEVSYRGAPLKTPLQCRFYRQKYHNIGATYLDLLIIGSLLVYCSLLLE